MPQYNTFEFSFWTELVKDPNTFLRYCAILVRVTVCSSYLFIYLFIYVFIYLFCLFLFYCFVLLFEHLVQYQSNLKIFTQVNKLLLQVCYLG